MLPDSLVPTVIALHEDGNPETESDAVVAWWDGTIWRYGQAGDPEAVPPIAPFSEVSASQLEQWASLLLGQNIPGFPDEARYESLLSDDLSGIQTWIPTSTSAKPFLIQKPAIRAMTILLCA